MFNFRYKKIQVNSYVKFKVIPYKYKDCDVYGNRYLIYKPHVITDYIGNRIGWCSNDQLLSLVGKIKYKQIIDYWSSTSDINEYLNKCDLTILFQDLLEKRKIKHDKTFKKWVKLNMGLEV